MTLQRRRFRVTGTVQGVGFRPFVYRTAVALGLEGFVANDAEGVVIEAEGSADRLDELARRLVAEPPPLARVAGVEAAPVEVGRAGTPAGFRIDTSRAGGAPDVAVSVDVATCAACLADLADPANRRRFAYPFVNCTDCGPRYTIIRAIPYDRPATTMAGFTMCAACRAEYEDPADRRFHAEPNACRDCGPAVRLDGPDGRERARGDAALDAAAAALAGGAVLAVKGLGGYHLAVDAGQADAVAELRRRKHRDDKPFAVMVPDLATAHQICHLSPAATAALSSPRRPIVLAPRHVPNRVENMRAFRSSDQPVGDDVVPAVAPGVAPGLPELGLLLPYTPLHVLLLGRVGRPLVMTSGNLSDEPIAHDDQDARSRLGPLVDAVVTHDRPIHIRCDDSVVRALPGGAVQMVRRSRGYAPEPLPLPVPTHRHILAVGAELKSTVAVAKGDTVVASHHIGDLEHLAAYQSFLQAVEHLCHIAGVDPDVVAHDLHPEYLSTKYAVDTGLPLVGVQHHHAHIASCLVDHGRADRVLGIAFDGLGLGCDGQLWGGEFLVADLGASQRVGHLRPVPLPGGARAIREPWRMALAWVRTVLGHDEAARYGTGVDERWASVMALVESPTTPTTTSAGRLFDAVAALLGLRPTITYEGQAAIALEAVAAGQPSAGAGYPATAGTGPDGLAVLDPAPLLAGVIGDRDRGVDVGVVSARFHAGLGQATAALAAVLAARHGLSTVALSGGVFQNARLTAAVVEAAEGAGLEVLVHHRVPPNDGGISIGQAAVAAATGQA